MANEDEFDFEEDDTFGEDEAKEESAHAAASADAESKAFKEEKNDVTSGSERGRGRGRGRGASGGRGRARDRYEPYPFRGRGTPRGGHVRGRGWGVANRVGRGGGQWGGGPSQYAVVPVTHRLAPPPMPRPPELLLTHYGHMMRERSVPSVPSAPSVFERITLPPPVYDEETQRMIDSFKKTHHNIASMLLATLELYHEINNELALKQICEKRAPPVINRLLHCMVGRTHTQLEPIYKMREVISVSAPAAMVESGEIEYTWDALYEYGMQRAETMAKLAGVKRLSEGNTITTADIAEFIKYNKLFLAGCEKVNELQEITGCSHSNKTYVKRIIDDCKKWIELYSTAT